MENNSFKLQHIVLTISWPKVLQDVALLLLAMPVTQVSVERLFSALKLIKTDSRNRLKEDILDALLLLKAVQ